MSTRPLIHEDYLLNLIQTRSELLHMAGSVSHRKDNRDAIKEMYEKEAERIKTCIVHELIERHPDNRPEPKPEFEYNGKRMVLQRWDGINAWYVSEDKYGPALYEYKLLSYYKHIEAEISRH